MRVVHLGLLTVSVWTESFVSFPRQTAFILSQHAPLQMHFQDLVVFMVSSRENVGKQRQMKTKGD